MPPHCGHWNLGRSSFAEGSKARMRKSVDDGVCGTLLMMFTCIYSQLAMCYHVWRFWRVVGLRGGRRFEGEGEGEGRGELWF
jgi:hypothetical protein